jgi:hypothetical protein
MYGTCNMRGEMRRCIQNFDRANLKRRDYFGGGVTCIWEDNIVTDLLKALLGNGSVKAFQHTRHARIRRECFLCGQHHATIRWKCFICGPRYETVRVLCSLRGPCRVYIATVVDEN